MIEKRKDLEGNKVIVSEFEEVLVIPDEERERDPTDEADMVAETIDTDTKIEPIYESEAEPNEPKGIVTTNVIVEAEAEMLK